MTRQREPPDRTAAVQALAERWAARYARVSYVVEQEAAGGAQLALLLAADAGLDAEGLRELARRIGA